MKLLRKPIFKKIKKKIDHHSMMVDEWSMGLAAAAAILVIIVGREIKYTLKNTIKRENKR